MGKKKRNHISQKTRFEVFKRDDFKCRYCGATAPSALLEIDHINPLSKGGTEEFINYITACEECNRGKGATELSDNTVVERQRGELEALNERRAQLEMLLEWRDELAGQTDREIDSLIEVIDFAYHGGGIYLTFHRNEIKRWARRYGLRNVIASIDPAADQSRDKGLSWDEFFDLVGRIARVKQLSEKKPYIQDLYYIRGILRNRLDYVNERWCIQALERAVTLGVAVDAIKDIALSVSSWSEFKGQLENLEDIQMDES